MKTLGGYERQIPGYTELFGTEARAFRKATQQGKSTLCIVGRISCELAFPVQDFRDEAPFFLLFSRVVQSLAVVLNRTEETATIHRSLSKREMGCFVAMGKLILMGGGRGARVRYSSKVIYVVVRFIYYVNV
jgi:hypothetical protein